MATYLMPISIGIVVFPFIAMFLTLPYIIRQYSKYGAIPFTRTIVVYSFVLYLLCAFFLIILPLPAFDTVRNMTSPTTQLVPFQFIADIAKGTSFNILQPSTYLSSLKTPAMFVVIYNIFLTVPFGVYLRYYFNRKWWQVIIFSFLLSLFFECTQFSALYGIYPRPYRLFDVDDLILNTSGGLLGHLLTPLFCFFLPSREELDRKSYIRGKRVSFTRRLCALFLDFVVLNFLILILKIYGINLYNELFSLLLLLYFIISNILFKGRTIGKWIINIKVVSTNEKTKFYNYIIRYLVLYVTLYLPNEINKWTVMIHNKTTDTIANGLLCLSIILILKTFIDIFKRRDIYFYETLSKTKLISTIKVKYDEDNNEANDIKEEKEDEKT